MNAQHEQRQSSDQLDDLVSEIAAKHRIAVGPDDPVLILHTLNARLLRDSARTQQEMLTHHQQELANIAAQWEQDAKAKAERILNVALAASKEAAANLLQANATATAVSVRKEIEATLTLLYEQTRDAKKVALWNIAAALVTLVAAVTAAVAVFWR